MRVYNKLLLADRLEMERSQKNDKSWGKKIIIFSEHLLEIYIVEALTYYIINCRNRYHHLLALF